MEVIYDCLVVARTYYGAFYLSQYTIGHDAVCAPLTDEGTL